MTLDESAVDQGLEPSTAATEAPASESSEQPLEGGSESEASTQGSAPQSEEEESLLVTKEELAEIKKNPSLSKLYRSLNKGFTQKTQTLAEERRSAQQAMSLVQALQSNPEATIRELAKHANIQLGPTPTAKAQADALNSLFGPELGPQIATAVKQLVDTETSSIRQVAEQSLEQTRVASATAVLQAFEDTHPDLKTELGLGPSGQPITIQSRMRELSEEWQPTKQMDPTQYLNRLYKMAKADLDARQTKAQAAADVVQRLNSSARASDTPSGVAPPKQVAHSFPTGRGAFQKAFQMAARGERASD